MTGWPLCDDKEPVICLGNTHFLVQKQWMVYLQFKAKYDQERNSFFLREKVVVPMLGVTPQWYLLK